MRPRSMDDLPNVEHSFAYAAELAEHLAPPCAAEELTMLPRVSVSEHAPAIVVYGGAALLAAIYFVCLALFLTGAVSP